MKSIIIFMCLLFWCVYLRTILAPRSLQCLCLFWWTAHDIQHWVQLMAWEIKLGNVRGRSPRWALCRFVITFYIYIYVITLCPLNVITFHSLQKIRYFERSKKNTNIHTSIEETVTVNPVKYTSHKLNKMKAWDRKEVKKKICIFLPSIFLFQVS